MVVIDDVVAQITGVVVSNQVETPPGVIQGVMAHLQILRFFDMNRTLAGMLLP